MQSKWEVEKEKIECFICGAKKDLKRCFTCDGLICPACECKPQTSKCIECEKEPRYV